MVDLVERKVPVELKMGAENVSIHFTHDCKVVLYKQLIQTCSVLLLLPLSFMLGFPLYEETGNGRAATHQPYSFAIEV